MNSRQGFLENQNAQLRDTLAARDAEIALLRHRLARVDHELGALRHARDVALKLAAQFGGPPRRRAD